METEIALRRLRKVVLRAGSARQSDEMVATIAVEASQLGYAFSPALMEALRSIEMDRLVRFSRELLTLLARTSGANKVFEPLYAGFPDEVVSTELATLYLNAWAHYHTAGTWRPPTSTNTRPALADVPEPTLIGLADRTEFEAIFTRLAGARSSLSASDVADVGWFIRQYRDGIVRLLPETFSHRENVALVAGLLWEHVPTLAEPFIQRHLTTATDMLRWWVALSGGDVSLAAPTKLVTLPRRVRRLIANQIEAAPNIAEDMWRRPERWKRAGERLHPGEFRTTHPKMAAAFDQLRSGRRPATFASNVERSLATANIDAAIAFCREKPGELARRLDVLIRRHQSPATVLREFDSVVNQVSTPVLLQLIAHFEERAALATIDDLPLTQSTATSHSVGGPRVHLRAFLPKGQTSKLWARPDDRSPISPGDARTVVNTCQETLRARFASLAPLGRCFVDPALSNFAVPLTQRSSSRSLRTLARGSRLALPDARTIRLFLWWKNGRARTDIDLSASLFDNDYRYIDVLSYYNLKSWGAVHSGDIVDAPNGAAEFIDLDTQELTTRGIRYIVATLTSYTEQPYCELPECFAGWMARQAPGLGEIFDPRTVIDRVDLTAETTIALPLIFDLRERQAIWTDLSLRSHPRYVNAVGPNLRGVTMLLECMATLYRPNLQTLFTLHARARGEVVDRADSADTVFGLEQGVTPFDIDRIRAEYL